jgi:hypothetical protein
LGLEGFHDSGTEGDIILLVLWLRRVDYQASVGWHEMLLPIECGGEL